MITCDFCGNDENTGDKIPLCHSCYLKFGDPESKYYQPKFVQEDFHGVPSAS